MQGADEITSGNNVRHRADHRGHTVDLKNKAGKHNRRQERGVQGDLSGIELVAGNRGNQQPHPQGTE
ncbi:Uncharacterised protein [Shigella sonnei]|nr:Uncharacterised protein [Shigella sonnei]CSF97171.1 Uncharacterised protein [Shigella sonnei]